MTYLVVRHVRQITKTLFAVLMLLPVPGFSASDVAPESPPLTMQALLEQSAASDWRSLDPQNTLYLDLPTGRVVIELASAFAPQHVANIRALASAGYWDGLTLYRVHDNFVVQWGDPEEDEQRRKPLPDGVHTELAAEVTRASDGLAFTRLPDVDGWAPEVGFSQGFPVGVDPHARSAWLAHCYGVIGAARDLDINSSTGTDLYAVIGQSPRQLDQNMTMVGRVVKGMELLSALPRGAGALGFYDDSAQRVVIKSVKLAAAVAPAQRQLLQVLKTDTALFAALLKVRRNRAGPFYKRPAGHIDLCNVPVPVREVSPP